MKADVSLSADFQLTERELGKLEVDNPKFSRIADRLIELYRSPHVRFHLIYPPEDKQVFVTEAARGSEVYFAIDADRKTPSETPDNIVGAVTLHPLDGPSVDTASVVEIARLSVDPRVARRGVGTKLLDNALDRVFGGNTEAVVLGLLADAPGWEIARNLYLKKGFIDEPEHSRIIPVRPLGAVEEFVAPPIPGAKAVEGQYLSFSVPMLAMSLSKDAYNLAKMRRNY